MGEEEPIGGFIVPLEVAEYLKRGMDDPQLLEEIARKFGEAWARFAESLPEIIGKDDESAKCSPDTP